MQGAVIEEGVHVALVGEEGADAFAAPGRPVVLGEQHVALVAVTRQAGVEVLGPGLGVTHLRAAGGKDVVHHLRGVFRHAQGAQLRQVQVHLCRRLGARGQLELYLETGDGAGLQFLVDQVGGRDQGDSAAARCALAQAGIDLAFFATGQQAAELELRAAAHGVAGVDVLAHHVFHEPGGGEHLDLAGLDVGFVDDPAHATEVVDVGVAVDHRHHRFVRTVLVVQVQRRLGGFGHGQRVDDDQPVVAFDDGHVRQVKAAHLIQAWADFEQSGMGAELGQAPEARVDRLRGLVFGEEVIGLDIPDDLARGVLDLALERRDQTLGDRLVVGAVGEGQLLQHGGVTGRGLRAGCDRFIGGDHRLRQAGSDQASEQPTRAQGETRHGVSVFYRYG
ncbi:hypothetical protein D3C85_628190 [compost metagenome]